MILTKHEILAKINSKELSFKPQIDAFQLQPHAVDLRLGLEFKIPKSWELTQNGREVVNIDPLEADLDNFTVVKLKPGQYFELLPKEFVLATTLEEIAINDLALMAVLYPRSSINRRGLAVDLSGIIDVGYQGKLIIPLVNNTNDQVIRVYPGERICQVVFSTLARTLTKTEAMQHGINGAKYHKNKQVLSKVDKSEETLLIKTGELNKLKTKYSLAIK